MSISVELQEVKGEVADALRGIFENEGSRLFLLKREPHSGLYTLVAEVTAGWRARFNEYRGQMGIRIATTATGFVNTIGQSSHFAYGVADGDGAFEVFGIEPDRRDVIAPNGNSAYWKIYGTKAADERYTPEEEEE
jgi:hypothetical protein